jgi:hypothetical protein
LAAIPLVLAFIVVHWKRDNDDAHRVALRRRNTTILSLRVSYWKL